MLSKYLDRNVRWVLFILVEYIFEPCSGPWQKGVTRQQFLGMSKMRTFEDDKLYVTYSQTRPGFYVSAVQVF